MRNTTGIESRQSNKGEGKISSTTMGASEVEVKCVTRSGSDPREIIGLVGHESRD